MRLALILIISLYLPLSAQLSAPQLRCLEVENNGNVKLTWIPPADPGGLFFSYEIYHSQSSNGTYTLVPGGPVNHATTTFTHVGGVAGYYFVVARYGPAGASVTPSSDTLRTIFLNNFTISGAPDLKLTWNDLHKPRLSTAAPTYTLFKEYPPGTINSLAITLQNNYSDTITVCFGKFSYRVMMADEVCTSASNMQGGLFKDQKQPNLPYIDSISVLPDGSVAVGWRAPRDPDVIAYEIQYGTSTTGGSPVDTVYGRNSSLYNYSLTVATKSIVNLSPKAIDSCGNGSEVDYSASTMLLRANYNTCRYSTELTWNPYSLRGNEVKEYQIYYSVNGGAYKLVGTTTSASFTHDGVAAGQNISYFIRMISFVNGVTSSSNRVHFAATQVPAPAFLYVMDVSVLSPTQVVVAMLIDTSEASSGADIYRSEDKVNFVKIGTAVLTGGSYCTFTDTDVDAMSRIYYYKADFKDDCGNTRGNSNIACTILLQAADDANDIFTKHLSWNHYEGFAAGVSGYNIYRVLNNNYDRIPLASVNFMTTSYSDNLESAAGQGGKIVYYVEAVESLGNIYGVRGISLSNERQVFAEGEVFVPNAFTPEGENRTWKPVLQFADPLEYRAQVFDRWGHVIFETRDLSEVWTGKGLAAGAYTYLVTYRNTRGEYEQKTGVVMLMR